MYLTPPISLPPISVPQAVSVSGDVLALVGVIIAAAGSLFIGIRANASTSRSASAAEVEALGGRLDSTTDRLDRLESRDRMWTRFCSDLLRHIRAHGDGTPPPDAPKGLNFY